MSQPTGAGAGTGGVRRHHTISASSGTRHKKEAITEEVLTQEPQSAWPEDEVLDPEWVGGVGAVGEKTSLHRQSSLPTRYHRGFQAQPSKSGNVTPKTMNSLSAIAGHDGEEDEDYAREIDGVRNEDPHHHAQVMDNIAAVASPLSPHFGPPHVPSPPPATSGIRRHQSLTYGAGRQLGGSGLKRSGTLQGQVKHSAGGQQSPSPPGSIDDYQEPDSYFPPSPGVTSPIGRQSPWNGSAEQNWRGGSGFSNASSNNSGSSVIIDDVTRALSALDVQSNNSYQGQQQQQHQGLSAQHPPRFNSNQGASPLPSPGLRSNGGKLQLVTNFEGRQQQAPTMPASASPYVPPIGHALHNQLNNNNHSHRVEERGQTASGAGWEQKDRLVGRASNPNLHYGYQQQHQGPVPPMPQYLQQPQGNQQGQSPRMGAASQPQQAQHQAPPQGQAFANTPIDVPSLIAAKGYNPANFDIHPGFARFFVIKSYTEDDVHKSLKYEIWSSTDPGNKRLDKAFKECGGRGPIYLFFSVNASGHFCGMAEMLTPVDYTRSSTVWASDKWKGVFKVRWIFVRDIPNVNLRHIKLNNTQERKPVTNSRDTQELLPDAGQEMLRIFHIHPARTSLLQDFAFYELQAMQKLQVQNPPSPTQSAASLLQSPNAGTQTLSPTPSHQSAYGMGGAGAGPNTATSPYGGGMPPQNMMTPQMHQQMYQMMQQQQQYGGPSGLPSQAMHQSVMRHPNGPGGQGGYGGMPNQGY